MLARTWEKGTLLHCWQECTLVKPLWKTVRWLLKKIKIELPYDPAIPLLGVYSKKKKTLIQKDKCTAMFIAALFVIAKIWKQPKCLSTDERIKKMWHRWGAESRHPLPTMVLGTGLPCLSLGAQDKYSSDVDAGKQTEALGQSQRSWESATASDFNWWVSLTDRLFVK